MNVAFIYDPGCLDGSRGGAELAMDEFADLAPDGVNMTSVEEADTVVIGNCVHVPFDIAGLLEDKVVWRFHHDLARDESPDLWDWLAENARHIFTSPLHVKLYGWQGEHNLVPPCPRLTDFRPNREARRHPKREGIVTVGSWQSQSKGARLVSETIYKNELVADCYGTGAFPPYGDRITQKGPVAHADLPAILHRYEQFIFLPIAPEPFGRCVAEAYAAGCEVMTNDLVGAKWWIENEPDRLWSATEDFWGLIGGH